MAVHTSPVGEGGIDYGGPRREFFRLLGNNARDNFFQGQQTFKFFSLNVSALQVFTYLIL